MADKKPRPDVREVLIEALHDVIDADVMVDRVLEVIDRSGYRIVRKGGLMMNIQTTSAPSLPPGLPPGIGGAGAAIARAVIEDERIARNAAMRRQQR